jgi:hypothetical protein
MHKGLSEERTNGTRVHIVLGESISLHAYIGLIRLKPSDEILTSFKEEQHSLMLSVVFAIGCDAARRKHPTL